MHFRLASASESGHSTNLVDWQCILTGRTKLSFGWTALHMSIQHEHHEIMEALIKVIICEMFD